jgi:hypothetical protein
MAVFLVPLVWLSTKREPPEAARAGPAIEARVFVERVLPIRYRLGRRRLGRHVGGFGCLQQHPGGQDYGRADRKSTDCKRHNTPTVLSFAGHGLSIENCTTVPNPRSEPILPLWKC